MAVTRPGLHPRRMAALMRAAVDRCRLDLSGAVVLTEAATGPYVVTPILAAMAGADQVHALARATRYGSIEQLAAQTMAMAEMVGVADRIQIVSSKDPALVARADIVTNSGHVRPIDAAMVALMKPTAVVPLMYEAWELRGEDIDINACERHGITVAGTDERHPDVDVFSYLGILAVQLLLDAGVAVYGSRVLLLCDNPFRPFIERGLTASGAHLDVVADLSDTPYGERYDAIVIALQPRAAAVLQASHASRIADCWPGAVVAQFWGDVDRDALAAVDVPVWPAEPPPPGHMAILLSAAGPEPVIRLQVGGLKVGELLWRARQAGYACHDSAVAVVKSGFGTLVHDATSLQLVRLA